MASSNKNKHLTREERIIIETGIRNGSSKKSIADTLGKDKSTIAKEIKLHRIQTNKMNLALECVNYKTCKLGRHCKTACSNYVPFTCTRRDRSPGACNGCGKLQHCHYDHFKYDPVATDQQYHSTLIESRASIDISEEKLKRIGKIIHPLTLYFRSTLKLLFPKKLCIRI